LHFKDGRKEIIFEDGTEKYISEQGNEKVIFKLGGGGSSSNQFNSEGT